VINGTAGSGGPITSTGSSWLTNGNSGVSPSSFVGNIDPQDLVFKTANTEKMRIAGSGAGSLITVSNTSSQVGIEVHGSDPSFSSIYINATNGTSKPGFGYEQAGTLRGGHWLSSTGDWFLDLNGAQRMIVLASTGNVGIGTNSPGQKLTVANAAASTDASAVSVIGGATSKASLFLGKPGTPFYGAVQYDNNTNMMELWTVNTPRIRIDNNGATYILNLPANSTVVTNAAGALATVTGTPATGAGITNYTARWITPSTLGTGALVDNGSNVGIGTGATPPNYTLSLAPGNPFISPNPPTAATSSGSDLTIKSGDAQGSNQSAGRLFLRAGASTGNSGGSGSQQIAFLVTPPGTSGSAMNPPLSAISINDIGQTCISTNYSGNSSTRLYTETNSDPYSIWAENRSTTGNSYGVYAVTSASGGANHYAVNAYSVGATTNYGVSSIAQSAAGGEAYALFGDASGAGNNWAGYFGSGNVFITNRMRVGGSSITAPTYPVDIVTPSGSSAYGMNQTDGNVVMSTYISSNFAGAIGTQSNHPFFIYTNNGGARLTVMNGTGNVGIGITTPSYKLHSVEATPGSRGVHGENSSVVNNDGYGVFGRSVNNPGYGYGGFFQGGYMGLYSDAQSTTYTVGYGVYANATGSAGTRYGLYGTASGAATNYGVYCAGNGGYTGTWTLVSDRRFKDNIEPVTGILEQLMKLEPVTYNLKQKEYDYMNFPAGRQYGLIAQDVEKVFPELVETSINPGKLDDKGRPVEGAEISYKAMNYIGLTPILVEAIKEQQKQIEEMKRQLEEQKKLIDVLIKK
jgi:hypothetical protein